MAYIKTEWQTGDVITAPRMNKIEQGIADLNDAVEEIDNSSDSIFNVIDAIRNEPLTQGALLQTGRVYETLCIEDFDLYKSGYYLNVISGNTSRAQETALSGWSIYRHQFEHRIMFRVDIINKNAQVSGVLPLAAKLGSTYYSIDLTQVTNQTYFVADEIMMNYFNTYDAPAVDSFSITFIARREFEDAIVCLDHVDEFDSIVVFGDSIGANWVSYTDGTSTGAGNGVMAQFVALMGLPVNNHAVAGATLSTMSSSPKNVVKQVQDYVASPDGGSKPLFIIEGGTNDQANYHLGNIGEYGTDTTSTVYGAIKTAINALLGLGVQPWQILVLTPIPKGIRAVGTSNGAAYVAGVDAELTTIAEAMYEVGVVQGCNVINGYHSIFANLDAIYSRYIMMPDDTHPSVAGAKYLAEYMYNALGGLKSTITVSGTTMIVS